MEFSNGISISFENAWTHLPFLLGQENLNFSAADFDLIFQKVEAEILTIKTGHARFAGLVSILSARHPARGTTLISNFIQKYFQNSDEILLSEILSPLQFLEQIEPKTGNEIISCLLDCIDIADSIPGPAAHAILTTIRRISKCSNLSENEREKIFEKILAQIEREKVKFISTLLVLFDHYHTFYPSRKIDHKKNEKKTM